MVCFTVGDCCVCLWLVFCSIVALNRGDARLIDTYTWICT